MRTYILWMALLSYWGFKSQPDLATSRKPASEIYAVRQDTNKLRNSALTFERFQLLAAAENIKSVLFNSAGTKLYALNLEGMCIYEFDQSSKQMLRRISFKPTRASGWDYALHKAIPSYAEKPIEACFSHQDRILWVSLHNAGGIVPLVLDTLLAQRPISFSAEKQAWITDFEQQRQDTLHLRLLKTGEIPKVIAKTADDKFLMVSNWGTKSLSVFSLNDTLAPYAMKIASIPMPGIPRGIAVDDEKGKTYVAIMGGNQIAVIDHKNWKLERCFPVGRNPRHLLMGREGRLFASFNAISQVACYQAGTGKLLFKTGTHLQPRSIALSADQQYLFVTCYEGNRMEVFKISSRGFTRVYSFKCTGKPVGIALYENKYRLEAWVSCYLEDRLKVFVFRKS